MNHTRCTISWRREIGTSGGFVNLGGDIADCTYPVYVAEPCGNPLYTHAELATGICVECATGHVTPTDDYATPAEFERARNSRSR